MHSSVVILSIRKLDLNEEVCDIIKQTKNQHLYFGYVIVFLLSFCYENRKKKTVPIRAPTLLNNSDRDSPFVHLL